MHVSGFLFTKTTLLNSLNLFHFYHPHVQMGKIPFNVFSAK